MMKWRMMFIATMLATKVLAQTTDWETLYKTYSKDNAIFITKNEDVKISFKEGKLQATTKVNQKQILLTDQAVGLYSEDVVYHGFFVQVKDIEATAIIPDGKKPLYLKATEMNTTRSENENVFYDDAKQTNIIYRGLKKGSVKRLSYTHTYNDVHFLPAFYFQQGVPTQSASFSVSCPKTVQLKYKLMGYDTGRISMTRQEKKNEYIYTWTANNIPSVKYYDDGLPFSFYIPHVQLYIEQYEDPQTHQMVRVLGNIKDLHNYYVSFINSINTKSDTALASLAATITSGAKTDRERAERIYKWVQQNIRYVAFEDGMGGFKPRESTEVCAKRYGDCKDMTSLQVALCRSVNVPAYYAWIGTRDIPYDYLETPLPIVDNHMICMTRIDNEWLYMDGTNNDIPFGLAPENLQGKKALVSIDNNNYELVEVPVTKAGNNLTLDTTFVTIDSAGELTGSIRKVYQGYGAWTTAEQMRYNNATEVDKTLQELLKRGSNKFTARNSGYRINADYSVSVFGDYQLGGYTKQAGAERYINLNLLRSYDSFIDTTERSIPVRFRFRSKYNQVIVCTIPKGYSVSYIPPNSLEHENDVLTYNIQYKHVGNEIILTKEFELKALTITPDKFEAYNKAVNQLKNLYKESIVFTKNTTFK